MAAQNGNLVLIKVGNGAMPTEAFTTIGGLRTSKMTLDHKEMESTNRESGLWTQLLSGAGLHSLTIEGSGLFTNSAAEETLRGYAFAASVNNYKFIFANGNNVTGAFMVTSYTRSGNYDEPETFEVMLVSAGALTFAVS
jgi:TP901-1 family phage major tail protein